MFIFGSDAAAQAAGNGDWHHMPPGEWSIDVEPGAGATVTFEEKGGVNSAARAVVDSAGDAYSFAASGRFFWTSAWTWLRAVSTGGTARVRANPVPAT